MAVKQKKSKKKIKKKFYEVSVPLTNSAVSLYAGEIEELEGKAVKLDLSRSLRGKGFEYKVKIKVTGEKAEGVPRSLILVNSYIRRMMRRGTDYVEDSFEAECRDAHIRIKPFLITRNKVSRAVRRMLRETTKKYLMGHLKTRDSSEIFTEIMSNKLQKQMSLKLKKIYPLALCEIRVFEVGKMKEEKKEKSVEIKEDSVEKSE